MANVRPEEQSAPSSPLDVTLQQSYLRPTLANRDSFGPLALRSPHSGTRLKNGMLLQPIIRDWFP